MVFTWIGRSRPNTSQGMFEKNFGRNQMDRRHHAVERPDHEPEGAGNHEGQ